MGPLIVNPKEDAVWLCWLSHVALVRFVVRPSFVASDKVTCHRLVDDFLEKFEAVVAWVGYEKPKMHLLEHLWEALECVELSPIYTPVLTISFAKCAHG